MNFWKKFPFYCIYLKKKNKNKNEITSIIIFIWNSITEIIKIFNYIKIFRVWGKYTLSKWSIHCKIWRNLLVVRMILRIATIERKKFPLKNDIVHSKLSKMEKVFYDESNFSLFFSIVKSKCFFLPNKAIDKTKLFNFWTNFLLYESYFSSYGKANAKFCCFKLLLKIFLK